MIDKNKLYRWQLVAFDEWKKSGKKSCVQSLTGTGKTLFALYCIQDCRCSTLIVCPTENLMWQWKKEILNNLDIAEDKVGVYYGKEKQIRSITICIINSVRELDLSKWTMCITDELHRYASPENIKPFERSKFQYMLGLSATIKREDNRHIDLLRLIGPIVFNYDHYQAQQDNIVSPFILVNSGVDYDIYKRFSYGLDDKGKPEKVWRYPNFADDKSYSYTELDSFIRQSLKELGGFPQVTGMVVSRNFSDPKYRLACDTMRAITKRRMLYSSAIEKVDKVLEVVNKHLDEKIIIFNEFIAVAESIYNRLLNGFKVGIYHSKSKDKRVIEAFSNGEINILVSVKSLNEGLDVKSASVGVVVSGNKVERNTIQRLGRILRKVEGKEAHYYQIYCKNTNEYRDTQERTDAIGDFAKEVIWQ